MSAIPPGPYYAPMGAPAPQPVNAAGLVGFILSMCGLLCALCFPIGFIVSLFGLRTPPKGFAIAGTVIGAVGTVLVGGAVLLYGTAILACMGTCGSFGAAMQPIVATRSALLEARRKIEDYKTENGAYPNETVGNALIQGTMDYWKIQIRYEPKNGSYVVRSAGPDQVFDTTDDMTEDDLSYNPDTDSKKWERDFQKRMEDAQKKNKDDGFIIPDVPTAPGPDKSTDSSGPPDKPAPAPADPRDEKEKSEP